MYRRLLTGSVLLALLASRLTAQVSTGSADVGTAFLTQPAIGSSSVLTAAASYSYATQRGALSATGLGARTPNDLYTGQGVLTAARYAPPLRRARWELAATASGFGVSGLAPSFGGSLLAREHFGGRDAGGFAGVTAGTVGQSAMWWRIFGAHAGGFVRLDDGGLDELSGAVAFTDAKAPSGVAIRYADLFGYWQRRDGPLELLLGAGARARTSGSLGTSGWASGVATLWMTSRLGIVVSGGRALEDVTRGVPSVRYFSVALRVGERNSSDLVAGAARHVAPVRREGSLEVRATGDTMRLVTVHADTARSVALMADFTGWESIAMTRAPNGTWTLERPIATGVHHVVISIDGGPWHVPANLARAADEFGGEVGLLAVP